MGVEAVSYTHLDVYKRQAFAIWSVIYVGLFVFTGWLWLPVDQAAGRVGPVAGLASASMLLNATWILVAQAGWVTVSVAVIVALLVVLTRICLLYTSRCV